MAKKKKNNITVLVIVIVSIVIVGGVLTWGFLTNWGQGKKSEPGTKSEPVKYTVSKKIPIGNKIEIENPESYGFKIGQEIEIGTGETRERRTIVGFGSLILDKPLKYEHPANTVITVVAEPNKKDFKVDNCHEYTVDLMCKECGDSYYLEDNKCKKYDVIETREILQELIKTPDQGGYKMSDNEYTLDGKNYGPIRTWQLGEDVKDLSRLFLNNATFNKNISGWDVSNVTNMESMFSNAYKFNQPLNNWNVSNVTNMESMFETARDFNQPLNKWDVSNVTNMQMMFSNVKLKDEDEIDVNKKGRRAAFNQDLSGWKLNCNVNINFMFYTDGTESSLMEEENGKYKPKKSTLCYDVVESKAILEKLIKDPDQGGYTMSGNEYTLDGKNYGPMRTWRLGENVTSLQDLFQHSSFNKDISGWDVSNVTNMTYMFYGATEFNQPLDKWDVSNVTNMASTFSGATKFNQPLNNWDVSKVTTMRNMFKGSNFNGDISKWDVSKVKIMNNMFYKATKFNQDISDWNVSKVTDMVQMFNEATKFNQDISDWNVSEKATENMFKDSAMQNCNKPTELQDPECRT